MTSDQDIVSDITVLTYETGPFKDGATFDSNPFFNHYRTVNLDLSFQFYRLINPCFIPAFHQQLIGLQDMPGIDDINPPLFPKTSFHHAILNQRLKSTTHRLTIFFKQGKNF